MKQKGLYLLLLSVMLCFVSADASLRLPFRSQNANQVTWAYDSDSGVYTFTTQGSDPYVFTEGFSRALADGECVISFEYKLDQQIPDFQIYFKAPTNNWSSSYSVKNQNLAAATEWTEFRLDVATQLSDWGVGAAGDQFRFDFGGVADKTIQIRKLHICKTANDPYEVADDGVATISKLIATGLPLLHITTEGGVFPTAEYVTPTISGAVGSDIINNEYVNGRLRIYEGSETATYDSGDYVSGTSGMRIRLRGNSSAGSYAKPFKIKLENSADLMLRGNDSKWADDEWLLIRDEKMVDFAGYKLSELLGMDFVPQCKFVNVWFNDQYQGLYLLQDYVKRNANCRINISDTGYLFEDDPYWWTASDYVRSNKYPTFNYTFRDPKLANMTSAQRSYIEGYLADYETAITNGNYADYIDINSLVNYALGHEILGTHDSAGANMYLTKNDNTSASKIKVALLWDFDTSETYATDWSNTKKDRLKHFYTNANHDFTDALVAKWQAEGASITNSMVSFLDAYENSALCAGHDLSVLYDNTRWNVSNPTATQSMERQKAYFPAKKAWLDSHMIEIPTTGNVYAAATAATPIPAGTIKNTWTFIGANITDELKSLSIEGNRMTTDWTVTGAASTVPHSSSQTHRSWTGAIGNGSDISFKTSQETAYNVADGSVAQASITVITNDQSNADATFTPVLGLTGKNGDVVYVRMGVTKSSPNRQTLTAYYPTRGLTGGNHFIGVEVIFPQVPAGAEVSLVSFQYELTGTRNVAANSTVNIQTHFYDQGGQGVGYHSYNTRSAESWNTFWRRNDVDSVAVRSGVENNVAGIDGLQYGYVENTHGVADGNPADVNGGLASSANGSSLWTHQQATDYYGSWYNYSFNVTAPCYATINLSTAQLWVYVPGDVNGNGDHGMVLTKEGNKMIWSRRYAGGAYVLSLDGENLKTNQAAFPSILKEQRMMYNNKGVAGTDAYSKSEFKELLGDYSRWTSTLLPDGTPNDTLFTYPYIVSVSENDYSKNFITDKTANSQAGDNYVQVPLTAGKHTLRVQNVYGHYNELGVIQLVTGDAVVPLESITLAESTVATLAAGEPLTISYTVSPANATDGSVEWNSNCADLVIVDNGNGTITLTYNGVGTRKVTVTGCAADGFGAEASLAIAELGNGSGHVVADPIPTGMIKDDGTYMAGSVNSDLNTVSAEISCPITSWTVTGAKEIRQNAATGKYQGWAGAVADGTGDVVFTAEQSTHFNSGHADFGNMTYLALITYNESGSHSVFEPYLRLTNTDDGTSKISYLGVAKDSPNRQAFTVYKPQEGLTGNLFNKIEVVFPDLDEGSVVSLAEFQFDRNSTTNARRQLTANADKYIQSVMWDHGGQGIGYSSYSPTRNNWGFNRRMDVDSIYIDAGVNSNQTGFDSNTVTNGFAFGMLSSFIGHSGWAHNPADFNGGHTNDANASEPWTFEDAFKYYGSWYNYTVNVVPDYCYGYVNIATSIMYEYASNAASAETNGLVLTPEGNKMIYPRRYAGGALVLELDGKNLPTNQKSYPSMLKNPQNVYLGQNGNRYMNGENAAAVAEYTALINDPTQWTSTLLADGTPNDTLFCWPNVAAPNANKYYGHNFYVDKGVNPDAGDQWAKIPLTKGAHTFKVKIVYGNRFTLGPLHITTSDAVIPVEDIELETNNVATVAPTVPVELSYTVTPANATDKSLKITYDIPGLKVEDNGEGKLLLTYVESESDSGSEPAGVRAKVRRKTKTENGTITIESADGFGLAEPQTITIGLVTGVQDVEASKQVSKVTYYNPLGVASSEPFPGVNVMVTTYDDGTKAASKIVK